MTLRRFNTLLTLVIVILGIYIIVTPFLPQISFWLRNTSATATSPYGGDLAKSQGSDSTLPPPIENRIVIPSIGINEEIIESTNIGAIKDGGTWRRPNSATPIEESNTVIVGHRFYGNNVSTFYHLDKVAVGQLLAVYWEGKEYLYEVTETKIVDPSAVDIEAPTTEKQLTIYTCTPIWSAKNRLAVIAKPYNPSEANSYE